MTHGLVATALLASGIAGAVALAALTLPLLNGSQQATSNGPVTTLTATATKVANNLYDCPKTETFGNLTYSYNPCARFPPDFDSAWRSQAYDALDSPAVQASINGAYEYHLVYFNQNTRDSIINVTGAQVITGNWTTGYQISYVRNVLLNVSVDQVGSSYEVTHISVYQLPDRQTFLGFSVQQKEVIAAAASDSKTESLMAGEPYYVVWVSPFEGNDVFVWAQCPGYNGNSTVVINSYDVQFNQMNGYRNVQVYVDQGFNVVARTSSDQPRSIEGAGNGLLITDPWIADYVQPQRFTSCPQ